MQQNLLCPGCSSPVVPDQRFCGICGTKLQENILPERVLLCQSCGASIGEGQQFCGTCGATVLLSTTVPTMYKSEYGSLEIGKTQVTMPQNVISSNTISRDLRDGRQRINSNGLLSAGGVIFLILGWIILVLGCLSSVALVVLAIMGGGFKIVIGDIDILGTPAIILGVAGFILSLIIGLEFLVIGRLCYAVNNIIKGIHY